MVLTRSVQKQGLQGVGESGSLYMALQVPHTNGTVNAGLHQGEACLGGEGPSRNFVLETCWALNTTLQLPSRARLWCQSWWWLTSSMEPDGESFAVCTRPSCQQDRAQSAEEIRGAGDFPVLKGQNQVWLFPFVFESLEPMQYHFPCWWILRVVLSLITGNKHKGQNWTRILREKSIVFKLYVCNNHLWEGLFFWKSTWRLRFIHFFPAFYLEVLINDFVDIKYHQNTNTCILSKICVHKCAWVHR